MESKEEVQNETLLETRLTPGEILQQLKQTVIHGKIGLDYTIKPRESYRQLKKEYSINDEKIKSILMDLDESDYIKSESSRNQRHADDVVHIFKKRAELMPKFEQEADYEIVLIYIKFTWTEPEKNMVIISFHKDN